MPNGIIFIDKPEGFTSHDAVAKSRRLFGTKKIGHAGTLDPMATGLLTLGIGPSTRLLTYMVGLDKTYTATIRLGAATVTDDREGEITSIAPKGAIDKITDQEIQREIKKLTGQIEQTPSAVSAIKVGGKRAYDMVRDGEEVTLKSRAVTIHSFQINKIQRITEATQNETPRASTDPEAKPKLKAPYAAIDIEVTVRCSSGTYIRALARDLGLALGTFGHLTALRRTAVGPFTLPDHENHDDSGLPPVQTVDIVGASAESEADLIKLITPPAEIARTLFDTITLNEDESTWLLQGKRFMVGCEDNSLIAALSPSGALLGLVEVKSGKIRSLTNFPQN